MFDVLFMSDLPGVRNSPGRLLKFILISILVLGSDCLLLASVGYLRNIVEIPRASWFTLMIAIRDCIILAGCTSYRERLALPDQDDWKDNDRWNLVGSSASFDAYHNVNVRVGRLGQDMNLRFASYRARFARHSTANG